MIQKNVVYQKSAKGIEAIATRQHGLGPKLRSMLILVNGKRSVDELVHLAQVLGDPGDLLGQLLDQGVIEPVAGVTATHTSAAAAPPVAAASAPAPLGASAPIKLIDAQRFVSRRLTDLLGPNAEDLCLRIEAARNLKEFQLAVGRAEGILRQYKSAHTAAEFSADVKAHMPSA